MYNRTMTITPDQIRAARALKNWSQSDLARRVNMATPSIGNIEAGKHTPTPQTQNAIIEAFEAAGIEFIDGGVRHRNDLFIIIEGRHQENAFLRLLDDIYYTAQAKEEVLWSFIDESLSPQDVIEKEKLIRQKGITYRSLVRHGDKSFLYPTNEYRWLPKGHFLNNLTVIYQNKFAVIVNEPGTHEIKKIIIINDPSIAEMKRREFEIIWSLGEIPS